MQKITLAIFILILTGCANLNSVHHDLNVANGNGVLIDIKQRAIISTTITEQKGDIKTTATRVCAEPSPDSLSAYAAELAGKASNGTTSVGLTSSFQEGASFVGLRTQSIQLLRDSAYRLCESYLSGAIDAEQYAWLQRRFQRNMVVLLAVEQLTGTVRAPNVTITTQGQAEAAQSLETIRNERNKINNKIKGLESENNDLTAQNKSLDKEKDKDTIAKNTTKIASNNEEITSLKDDRDSLDKAISNSRSLLTSGSTSATVSNVGLPQQPGMERIAAVSESVTKMVGMVMDENDAPFLCFSYFSHTNESNRNTNLDNYCETHLNGSIKLQEAQSQTAAPAQAASQNENSGKVISPPIMSIQKQRKLQYE